MTISAMNARRAPDEIVLNAARSRGWFQSFQQFQWFQSYPAASLGFTALIASNA
jgi:hypothetical protein